ncbi:MAG TPA: hypothetical protein PKZ99_14995, partial [Azospirillaceae bacterium]|nr:hypothetical protein [Azospirillaceae bacterium]
PTLKAAAPSPTAALLAQTPAAQISASVAERLANPYRDGQSGRFTTGPGKQAEAFAHRALGDRAKNERMDFGPVENHAEIMTKTGIDLSPKPGRAGSPWPYRYAMDSDEVRHAIREHGDAGREAARGQIAVTSADFRHVRDVFQRPDNISAGGLSKRHKNATLLFERKIGGIDYTVVGEIFAGKRRVGFLTMYKK